MRFRHEFTALLSIALVFGVFAAAAPPLRKSPFSLTIHTPKDVVKAGSEVRVGITLTNISDHDIYDSVPVGSSPSGEFYYRIEIRNDKGVRAPLTRFGYIARGEVPPPEAQPGHLDDLIFASSVLLVTVEPGKVSGAVIMANELYDLSRSGKYSIQVNRWDDESKTTVTSNTITVTVVPATQQPGSD
jgi:hypothetical protein